MKQLTERRAEKRLCYHWPVWLAEDTDELLSQGRMVDVSSGGAAFTCCVGENYPYDGQNITARFSVPHFGSNDCFDMKDFTRTGRVCRIDDDGKFLRRIAVQFAEPLPFKPGEQADRVSGAEQISDTATI